MPYINPRSVIAVGIFFPIAGALAVGTRFYLRRNKKVALGIDDWLCIPALVFVTGCSVIMIIGSANHTIGYHSQPKQNAGNDPQIVYLEKLEWAFNIMSPLALGFIKLSILFFYRRIFKYELYFNFLSWSLISLVILWMSGFVLTQIFDCKSQFRTNWGPLADLEKCISTFKQLLAYSISDVIVDVFIFTLPIPLIWALHIPTGRKLAVCGIFLLAALAIIAGILRLIVFAEILGKGHEQVVLVILGVTILDDMAVVSLILFWPMIEMGVAMVATCLPLFRPLFHGMFSDLGFDLVRSPFSLQSFRRGACLSHVQTTPTQNISNDSGAAIMKNKDSDESTETYVMANLKNDQDQHISQIISRIGVRHDLTQSVQHV